MSRPVVFSASSVWTYQTCSLQWWFAYVAALPAEPSYEMATGIAVHAAAEKILRGKLINFAVDEREAIAAYRLAMADTPWLPDDMGEALVHLFLDEVAPTVEPMLVEAEFQLEVNGIPYSGILDWYDRSFHLWDLKTVASRPSRGRSRYRFNQIGYALGARVLTGAEEAGTGLAYLVKTKRPYYWPVTSPTVSDDDIEWFAGQLEWTAEAVARGQYVPDGLYTTACKTCPYTAICGPYVRLHEGETA